MRGEVGTLMELLVWIPVGGVVALGFMKQILKKTLWPILWPILTLDKEPSKCDGQLCN